MCVSATFSAHKSNRLAASSKRTKEQAKWGECECECEWVSRRANERVNITLQNRWVVVKNSRSMHERRRKKILWMLLESFIAMLVFQTNQYMYMDWSSVCCVFFFFFLLFSSLFQLFFLLFHCISSPPPLSSSFRYYFFFLFLGLHGNFHKHVSALCILHFRC